jgi:hypothetical protein
MKRFASLTLLLLLASALLAAGAQQEATSASFQGTVHALQPKTGSLDVVTGVGMALRLVRLTAISTTQITSGGSRVPLSAVKRGDIVRVLYHRSGKQLVADRIEKVAAL